MALSTVAMLGALGSFVSHLTESPLRAGVSLVLLCLSVYLFHVNRLLSGTPEEVRRLSPHRWTRNQIRAAYRTLEQRPITTESFVGQVPPKLERRYIVTGGSGLVGGYIVLQLLARGQDPSAIRIVDFQAPHRRDMLSGPASRVGFVKADITSEEAVESAFSKTWPTGIKQLPVTVFHTAAVIVPSDRSRLVYGFCEAVNVGGTINVLEAAKRVGADVLIMTSSASISIRPVEPWVRPWQWKEWPKHYWQLLDEADFFELPREHEGYFANYPASKARAERIVCAANGRAMRTGCIRPANGVYGHPTDNTVGGPLNMQTYPAWSGHIVQSFVHGANCAIAHLQMEAVLAKPDSASAPQAGRPFTITDPNPPIAYADLWLLVETLSVTPFRTIPLLPVPMLLLSHVIEVYSLLPIRFPCLRWFMPPIPGNAKHLKPALFSITTHLFANNQAARKPVQEGGLGYTGVLGTLDGMSQELLEWNHEHLETSPLTKTKYTSSVSLAEEIERIRSAAAKIRLPSSSG